MSAQQLPLQANVLTHPANIPYVYKRGYEILKDGSRPPQKLAGPPKSIRVDLNSSPRFTKRYGQRVKDLGGTYSYCRGHHSTRYVQVPLEKASEAANLIREMIRDFGPKVTTVVFYAPGLEAHITVQHVTNQVLHPLSHVLASYKHKLKKACSYGQVFPVPPAPEEDEERATREYREHCTRLSSVVGGLKSEGYSTAYGTSPHGGNVCLSLDDMERLLAAAKVLQQL